MALLGGGRQHRATTGGGGQAAETWPRALQAEGTAWGKACSWEGACVFEVQWAGRWPELEEDQRAINQGQSCGPGRTLAFVLHAIELLKVSVCVLLYFLYGSIQSFISLRTLILYFGLSSNTIRLAKKFVWLMNTLFNQVLGENEKCLLFSLKTEWTF